MNNLYYLNESVCKTCDFVFNLKQDLILIWLVCLTLFQAHIQNFYSGLITMVPCLTYFKRMIKFFFINIKVWKQQPILFCYALLGV